MTPTAEGGAGSAAEPAGGPAPAAHVFLCHFGGPRSEEEVAPFLQRLFEDPLIIRAPLGRFLRGRLARTIARRRAEETARQYRAIGFSPINRYTDAQAAHLRAALDAAGRDARVHVVNRYTPPWADEVVGGLDLERARLFLISLYPHFCHSTSASSLRDVDQTLMRRAGSEALDVTHVYSWWHEPRYLDLTWRSLRGTMEAALDGKPGRLVVLFSAHGIPKRYALNGDPYPHEIRAHFEALRRRAGAWLEQRGVPGDQVRFELSFQSRVGRLEWLAPYTERAIEGLGASGGGHLLLVPISFVSDHIETLYEMDVTYRGLATASGFEGYSRVPGLNEDPELAACLVDVLTRHGL